MGSAVVKLNPLLRMAVIAGVEVAVKLHVARGDDLDARDNRGATPLMLASARRKKGIVQILLVAGANPKLLDSEGRGVIAYAEKGGCPECIALLREALDALDQFNESKVSDDLTQNESALGDTTKTVAFHTAYEVDHETPVLATQGEVGTPEVCLDKAHHESTLENTNSEIDDLLNFESTIEPQEFFARSNSESASGSFVAISSSKPVVWDDKEVDWDLNLTTAPIAGDGISINVAVAADHGAENDFLKVRNRGRKSAKRAVPPSGTRLSINPEICITWAKETLVKGSCSFNDVDRLIALCEGNGDFEELRINLQRNLESAGFDLFDHSDWHNVVLCDAKSHISDISSGELAEAIEAALTRQTKLPGTQKFSMDKSYEKQLLGSISRAKQELQLGILASAATIETILDIFDRVRNGHLAPESVSLRIIIPSRLNHPETAEIMAAVEVLKSWQANGRRMEGKQRREALDALDVLDISLEFYKSLVRSLDQNMESIDSIQLDKLISVYEAATARLICEHLPFARRFAARNVEEGEDPEDVFQVVFTGLHRSTRRFDSARGDRFVIYCTFWMQQALTRWRADESGSVRVPAHRYYNLTMLDRVLDKLDVRFDGAVSDNELATNLGWTIDQVRDFRRIPRNAEYFENIEDWDRLLPAQEQEDIFDNAETVRVVAKALAELDAREAAVIKMRFGIGCDEEMTLEEIGKHYDLTRERIRQIETKALQRLSRPERKAHLKKLMGIE